MKCLYCNSEFTPLSTTQKYCCLWCGTRYREMIDIKTEYPVRTFICRHCGKQVTTDGTSKDRRIKFCSKKCTKNYHKH